MNSIKKILIVFLIGSIIPQSSFAYDFIVNGFAYNIKKDGTVAVTYKNPKVRVNYVDGGYYGNIVIPRTVKYKNRTYRVTEIGERAFCYCDRVKSVKIPEGITRIGYLGVGYLKNIRSLYIPSSVKVLEAGCFAFNYGLSKVTVSKANKYYCSLNNCIYNKKKTALVFVCPKNRSYTFPSTVTRVCNYAFSCVTLKKLVVPKHVKYVGGSAFFCFDADVIENHATLKLLPGEKKGPGTGLPFWGYSPCTVNSTK